MTGPKKTPSGSRPRVSDELDLGASVITGGSVPPVSPKKVGGIDAAAAALNRLADKNENLTDEMEIDRLERQAERRTDRRWLLVISGVVVVCSVLMVSVCIWVVGRMDESVQDGIAELKLLKEMNRQAVKASAAAQVAGLHQQAAAYTFDEAQEQVAKASRKTAVRAAAKAAKAAKEPEIAQELEAAGKAAE